MDNTTILCACFAAGAAVSWALTYILGVSKWKHEAEKAAIRIEERKSDLEDMKRHYETRISDMEHAHTQALEFQKETLKAEMTEHTDALLKQREEELSRKAEETVRSISGDFEKELKSMREAFQEARESQIKGNSELGASFKSAVDALREQSSKVGEKADRLAEAMRGQKKFQGCWGETILLNMLSSEGLVEGRDFDKEETLRDELGFVLVGEDSDSRMRPDFILHYPDRQDVILDAKVSLNAFSDYIEAADDAARQDAATRNLDAIRTQVKRLAKKDYSKYLRSGNRLLDYVIMFIPNSSAYQLALSMDQTLWRSAYSQKVLITTEETIMPFLRMISIAWTNIEQVKNQQKIIQSAQTMIERVADFAKAHAEMGRKLDDAKACYDRCSAKIADHGQSILVSANQVIRYGVPVNPSKPLPEQ